MPYPNGYFLIDLTQFGLSEKELADLEAEINKAVLAKLKQMRDLQSIEFLRVDKVLGMVPDRPPVRPPV